MDKKELYRNIPKVDRLMEGAVCRKLAEAYGEPLVLSCVREELEALRQTISAIDQEKGAEGSVSDMTQIEDRIGKRVHAAAEPGLRKVINATGTVLHTNLGRAPIGKEIAEMALAKITDYTNIEYDLQTGERGPRGGRCEELLKRLTGAEDALIVNNNAASVLLILHAMCQGREVIVSRGELVEIGGHFRIPDVMEASGSILHEVGTTNKTRLADYEEAVTDQTAALMKVHTSNYRIVGFTDEVPTADLAALAHEHGLPMFEDLGSGALTDLAELGIGDEPTVSACVKGGADLVCFSADKLLGGPQAGIILGRHSYIDKLRHHPMMRALRTDKFTASVLELTLLAYLDERKARRDIPALEMMTVRPEILKEKAERLAGLLRDSAGQDLSVSVETTEDLIGGGALPNVRLKGYAVRVKGSRPASDAQKRQLLEGALPVVPRFAEGDLLLSVRTVDEADLAALSDKVSACAW